MYGNPFTRYNVWIRHTRHSQHTAHSQHAAHIPQKHSSTAHMSSRGSRQQQSHKAQGTMRRETAKDKSCRVQTAVLASPFAELSHCHPLPTTMLVRAHSPPLRSVNFFMVLAVCCKLCLYKIQSVTTQRHIISYQYAIQGASLRGRPTPPATLAQEDKVHQNMRSGQRSMIDYYSFM